MPSTFERLLEPLSPWTKPSTLFAVGRIFAGAYALGTFAYFETAGDDVTDRAVLRNALADAEQRRLTVALVVSFAVALAYLAFFAWRGKRRRPDAPAAALVGASYEPFLLAGLAFWPLYEANVLFQVRLFAIVAIAATFGASGYLYATRCPRARLLDVLDQAISTRVGAVIALLMGLAHGIVMARVAVMNFDIIASGWDLAIYSQVHWNITTTGIPWSTTYTDQTFNHYAIHFSPIYHLTSLLYLLHRAPSTLLVIENVALGLGALPLFLLVKRLTGRTIIGLLLAASYLVNPCANGLMLHDFHEIVLFVPLMLGLAWATYDERPKLTWVLVVFVLLVREDTPAYLAVYGVYLWLTGKDKIGRDIVVVALAYLMLVHGLIMPFLRGGTPYVFDDRYAGLVRAGQTGKASIVGTLATNTPFALEYVLSSPAKWEFVTLLFMSVACLPVLSRRAILLLLPGFAFSLLSSFSAQYSIEFHYPAPILPFLYFAAAVGLERWAGTRTAIVFSGVALLTTCLLAGKIGRDPTMSSFIYREIDRHRFYGDDAPRILAAGRAIPKDACVRATGNLLVSVSERRAAYIVPWGKRCDWAFLDYAPDARQAPSTNADEYAYMLERLRSREFGVTYLDERVVLMGRGQATDRNAELIERLERLQQALPH